MLGCLSLRIDLQVNGDGNNSGKLESQLLISKHPAVDGKKDWSKKKKSRPKKVVVYAVIQPVKESKS